MKYEPVRPDTPAIQFSDLLQNHMLKKSVLRKWVSNFSNSLTVGVKLCHQDFAFLIEN